MRASGIFLIVVLGSLAACDIDLFGTDAGKLAGGYKLKKVERFHGFEYHLVTADKHQGENIAQIGWQRPLIVVKFSDHRNWIVIDTVKNESVSISDEDRRTNPTYRE